LNTVWIALASKMVHQTPRINQENIVPKVLDRGTPREKYRVMSLSPKYLLVFVPKQTYIARMTLPLADVRCLAELEG